MPVILCICTCPDHAIALISILKTFSLTHGFDATFSWDKISNFSDLCTIRMITSESFDEFYSHLAKCIKISEY